MTSGLPATQPSLILELYAVNGHAQPGTASAFFCRSRPEEHLRGRENRLAPGALHRVAAMVRDEEVAGKQIARSDVLQQQRLMIIRQRDQRVVRVRGVLGDRDVA